MFYKFVEYATYALTLSFILFQLGFYVLTMLLARIDSLGAKHLSQVEPDYAQCNILVMHGLGSDSCHTQVIVDHLGPAAHNPLILYHGAGLEKFDQVSTEEIKAQFLRLIDKMMQNKEVGYLIAHSYSAGIAISLSMEGRLHKGLKLIFIAPMLKIHPTYDLKFVLMDSLFYTRYLFPKFGIMSQLLYRTNFLLSMDQDTIDVCRNFLHSHTVFSRNAIVEARKLSKQILLQSRTGAKMQNDFALILCDKDRHVCNETAKKLLLNDPACKEYVLLADSPHQPYASRNLSTRKNCLQAIDDALKKLARD